MAKTGSGMLYLVTGCSRGLGIEWVKQLLERGDKVVATCRDSGKAEGMAGEFRSRPNFVGCLPLDVSDPATIDALLPKLEQLGVKHIDVLVHNAGISAPTHPVDPIASATKAAMMACFDTNAVGPMLLTQALLPLLRAGNGKRVFIVSSAMASMAKTTAGGSVSYRASKAATNMVGRCLAGEHGTNTEDGLSVTLCHPGWCDTDMGSAGNRSPPVKPVDSVAGMIKVIDAMGKQSNADFLDYTGAPIEW